MARIGELAPELVVVSGDVFDHPRVSASPIATFARAVGDLMDRVPGTTVAIAAGLRDTPLDAGRLGPLEVVGELGGVEVATDSVRRIRVGDAGGSVTLVPHAALAGAARGKAVAEPDGQAKWNVLVAYAEADSGRGAPAGAVAPGRWDYVALGSQHVRAQVAEGVHYCGSLERIGSDPWKEAATDKGFVLADLRSGAATFFPVGARAVVSLASVDAGAGGSAAVARRLSEALASVPGGVDGKLVRVPVRGLGPDHLAAFDRDALEPLRNRVAELRVDALPARGREAGDAKGQAGARPRRGAAAEPVSQAGVVRTLRDLQAGALRPLPDLRGASGLVGLVGGALHEALAGSGADGLEGSRRAEPALRAALAGHPLDREQYAAVWRGSGAVETWLSAGVSLLQELGVAGGVESGSRPAGARPRAGGIRLAPRSLAQWLRRLVKETERDVARLERSEAETLRLKTRLASLREDAAETQGDIEAGVMGWVRERQDAETRLLLHRDRARELKDKLKEAEDAGEDAECAICGREVGDRMPEALQARREEWDGVVHDGRWWRKRRDQLEDKPAEIRAAETRALELDAAVNEVSEELERRRVQAQELAHARRRLGDLREAESRIAAPGAREAESSALVAGQLRERVHVETMTLTGGRLARTFPGLFADWARGGRRGGGDVAALELAARIALAELAAEAGVPLGSVLLPRGLDVLHMDDVPRALAQLSTLAGRVRLVLAGTSGRVVAAAPECFDYVFVAGAGPGGDVRVARRRPRPSPLRVAAA